jgi:hypothetical protein
MRLLRATFHVRIARRFLEALAVRYSYLALLIFLACLPARAGDCSDASIWLSAFDKSGAVETGLKAEDLRFEVGGKPTQALSFSLDAHPRRILVMVDTSGSMSASPGEGKLGSVLTVAGVAAAALPPDTAALLLTFGDKLVPESDDFETRQQVGQRVLDLSNRTARGRTALLDSIDQGLRLFGDPQFGDSIYLVSDGGDNHSRTSYSKLQEKLILRGVRVFVFLVPTRMVSEEEVRAAESTNDLARSTGGSLIDIPLGSWKDERAQLGHLALQVASQVQQLYKIHLPIAEFGNKPARVKITFADKSLKEDGHKITYARQLAPCRQNP